MMTLSKFLKCTAFVCGEKTYWYYPQGGVLFMEKNVTHYHSNVVKITKNAFTVEIAGVLETYRERIPFRLCKPTK